MYFCGPSPSLIGGRDRIKQKKVPYSALSTGWGILAKEGTCDKMSYFFALEKKQDWTCGESAHQNPSLQVTFIKLPQTCGLCHSLSCKRKSSMGATSFKVSEPDGGHRRAVSHPLSHKLEI